MRAHRDVETGSLLPKHRPKPKAVTAQLLPRSPEVVRDLQRLAGNQATTVALQRAPAADGTITDQAELERERPVGAAIDADNRKKILDAVKAAPRSKLALDAIEKLRGDLDFPMTWSGGGNFVHGTGKAAGISLNRSKNQPAWIASAVHEIHHLHAQLAGTTANVVKQSREDYVNTQMTEEIGAHAAGYVAQLQMGRATSTSAGYDEFVTKLKKDNGKLLADKDWPAIEALAKPFITEKYKTEWVGSASGKNYWDKWRAVWDAAHPTAKP